MQISGTVLDAACFLHGVFRGNTVAILEAVGKVIESGDDMAEGDGVRVAEPADDEKVTSGHNPVVH